MEINKLWYKMAKSAVGAVFNVKNNILEVILGIPPLNVTNRVITVKHYLKAICNPDGDVHRRFISSEIDSGNSQILAHLRDIQKFLKWKADVYPDSVNSNDTQIIDGGDVSQFFSF